MFILNLIVFIFVLGIIILIHELGHFFFAKKAGILCHEFAIGMGPAIYQKRKGETIYSIRSIPIGGYVSMAGESVSDALIKKGQIIGVNFLDQSDVREIILNESLNYELKGVIVDYDLYGKNQQQLFILLDVDGEMKEFKVNRNAKYLISEKKEMMITPEEKSFESKTLFQRFLVIFAGPFMNFVLAFALFFILSFFVLKPNLDSSELKIIGSNTPAEEIGLMPGDIITQINGHNISSWNDLSSVMSMLNSPSLSLLYTREGSTYQADATVLVQIQSAGLANVDADRNFFNNEPIIGTAYGRAKSDGQLQSGDLIKTIEIANEAYIITSWDDVIAVFRTHTSGEVTISVDRNGVARKATYQMISKNALSKLGYQDIVFQLGISPTESFDIGYTLAYPFKMVYDNTNQVIQTIGLLFNPSENLGLGDLSGPVGIFGLVSSTARQGLLSLLGFTAFLSINIGLLNLLPIPALDGGRLVFLGVEAITKKPLNRKLENTINNVMFFLLLGLFVFVTYNDILRLFRG